MPTLSDVQTQLASIQHGDLSFVGRQINALPQILRQSERIFGVAKGRFGGKTGIIVATSERVIMLHKGFLWGLTQSQIPLERISSVDANKGMLMANIAIWDGAVATRADMIQKGALDLLVAAVESARQAKQRPAHASPAQAGGALSGELAKLADLRNAGALTEDEFLKAKAKLLGA